VRVISDENEQVGIVSTDEALRMAADVGKDLVEVAPTERPPVCRIMDYGKWKYQQKQKAKQQHSHEVHLKEIRIRPKTDPHDRGIKVKRARTFLLHNDKVQFTMLFRGRERFHKDVGRRAFDDIVESLADISKIERPTKMEGRRMTMVLTPGKAKPAPSPPRVQAAGPARVATSPPATPAVAPTTPAAVAPAAPPATPTPAAAPATPAAPAAPEKPATPETPSKVETN